MRSFLTKLRKWHGNRWHLEAAETREDHKPLKVAVCKAGGRDQRDKRNNQQAQALLLTLSELQRTMDPVMAARVYNDQFCPLLSRLPDELLLCICDSLSGDFVTLFCLRLVSRKLRHLLDSRQRSIWGKRYAAREPLALPHAERLKFALLLQRDDRCNNCMQWNDAHGPQTFDKCKFQPFNPLVTSDKLNHGLLHCYACDSPHYTCRFSSTYQQPLNHEKERICLGTQGSVKLCEHIQITWAAIKAHVDDWRQQQRGREDWQACLDNFNIECQDPIHDTRCMASEALTWPRARLGISRHKPDIVVLNLEWKPHRRIDTLNLTEDGRIPATELRAMFRELRELGPVDVLCPASCRNALPEMAFFYPPSEFGRFVYHKTGEDDKIRPLSALLPPMRLDPLLWWYNCPVPLPALPSDSHLWWYTGYGRGRNKTHLRINPHYIKGAVHGIISSQCLMFRYEKDIKICNTDAITNPDIKINPTHQWLHAMDVETYPHPQGSHIRPLCRDAACANYYKRRKDHCTKDDADEYRTY
ncbi:hypothetical protein yc1106_10051 [Curvularia clavata]|uniref:F-box domain-containing protein n=1 Tax=Curvularia clavata TaxID=95742 RepID=A0A9Q9DXC2_CURCL|nr:hypothetical protein yc1106_10051 [Curvularia clavata]